MRGFLLLVLLVNLFLLYSCKKYKPADHAFFIKANRISVAATPGQGSASHKITDLWLYVNGNFKGAYPIGSLMPVVSSDKKVTINVFPGIKNNGIADTRIFWGFYDFLTIDTLVESGKTIERDFTFNYKSATTFTWMENFEASGFSIEKSPTSAKSFTLCSPADAFEGKSATMALSGTDYYARIESSGSGFSLPVSSPNVYLELNYKCNAPFSVGVLTDEGQERPAMVINAQDEWNKIYIQLSTVVSTPPVSSRYKVYFKLVKDGDDATDEKIFLDNIKLVYL